MIIRVTTRDETSSASEGYAAGCDDCIIKPFNRAVLLSKIEKHLSRSPSPPLSKPGDQ